MISVLTLSLLLGPPALVVVAVYAYYWRRRVKGKKHKAWKPQILNLPLSFLSAQWISWLMNNTSTIGIPEEDVEILEGIRGMIENIPLLEIIPAEIRLVILLTIIIYLILIPSP